MNERLDTYCGLYCGGCEIFLANKKGLVKEKAKEWKVKEEDLYCNGCKTDITSIYCRACHFKDCAKDKEIEYCYQCQEFPCIELTNFKEDDCPHHSIVLHSQESIKNLGIDRWLKEQEARWSCPQCKEKYSWYDSKCSNCGSNTRNCIDDERELEEC